MSKKGAAQGLSLFFSNMPRLIRHCSYHFIFSLDCTVTGYGFSCYVFPPSLSYKETGFLLQSPMVPLKTLSLLVTNACNLSLCVEVRFEHFEIIAGISAFSLVISHIVSG